MAKQGENGIQWCDETWNPIRGCSRVSAGCQHCYAELVAARFSGPGQPYEGLARRRSNGEPQWTGVVRVVEEHMLDPLRWKRPRRVFTNSMSDLFHEGLTDENIIRIFGVMMLAERHQFQVLTKRPERMAELLNGEAIGDDVWFAARDMVADRLDFEAALIQHAEHPVWPLPNVWLGTSVENQEAADERIPHLVETPAAVRFLSCEPLLGPLDITEYLEPVSIALGPEDQFASYDLPGVDWVIAGGESGPHARPMHAAWARFLRDQCVDAGVPYFFKQWGEYDAFEVHVGKKRAGRELDGRVWDEFPRELAHA